MSPSGSANEMVLYLLIVLGQIYVVFFRREKMDSFSHRKNGKQTFFLAGMNIGHFKCYIINTQRILCTKDL